MPGAWDVSLWIYSDLIEEGQPYWVLLRLILQGCLLQLQKAGKISSMCVPQYVHAFPADMVW